LRPREEDTMSRVVLTPELRRQGGRTGDLRVLARGAASSARFLQPIAGGKRREGPDAWPPWGRAGQAEI